MVETKTAPVPTERVKRFRPMERSGVSSVAVQGGYVVDKERNPLLVGQRKFQTFSELLANVDIIGSVIRYFMAMIARPPWTVEPAKDGGARAKEIAELVENIIHDLERPWTRVVKRAALATPYGYSWQEWIAKRRPDGVVGLLDIEPRSHATIVRWDVDEAGNVFGVWQQSPQTFRELYIPRAKSVYVIDDTLSESPEGLGIMRNAAPAGLMVQRYEQLEGIGFESDMRGIPVGRAPYEELADLVKNEQMTQSQAAEQTAVIESVVQDHIRSTAGGVVLDSSVYEGKGEDGTPSGAKKWDLSLLSADVGSMDALANAINRKTRGIARLFHLEGFLLGESGAGSMALARSKADAFGMVVDGTNVELESQFGKDIVGPLMLLNGWPEELKPRLHAGKLQHRDISEIAEVLVSLSRAGAPLGPNDEDTVNAVRDLAGLPRVRVLARAMDAGLRGKQPQTTPEQGDEESNIEAASASEDKIDDEDIE